MFTLILDQRMNSGSEHQLHRQTHFAARHYNGVGAGHVGIVEHLKQIRKVLSAVLSKSDYHGALVRSRYVAGDERVRSVYQGHALEIDVGA